MKSSQTENPAHHTAQSAGWGRNLPIHLTVFVTGAAVLVLEILGTRFLSPFFGNNVYVWSSLISVTLLALALGYWIGGGLADAKGTPRLLDSVIAGAAVFVALTPPTVRGLAGPLSNWSFEAGVLAAALVCFGPALFLLGMISPIAVRISAQDLGHVGRSAGSVYATSTAGSIVGALAAGFLLLPRVPVSRICYTTAAALLALAAARRLGRGHSWRRAVSPIAGFVVLGWLAWPWLARQELWTDRPVRVVSNQPSFYGTVRVLETRRMRYLMVDGVGQSVQNKADRRSLLPYVPALGLLPYLRPARGELLLIGLGGGDLVRLLNRYKFRTTAVEIDRAVAEASYSHFGLGRGDFRLVVHDGRSYVRRSSELFDFVVLDAFAAGAPPGHLFTQEAFTEIKQRLRRGGICAVNLIGDGSRDPLVAELAATLRSVFPHVFTVRVDPDANLLGNFLVFASDDPLRFPERWEPSPPDEGQLELLEGLRTRVVHTAPEAEILTDERNSIDLRVVGIERQLRAMSRKYFPPSILHP